MGTGIGEGEGSGRGGSPLWMVVWFLLLWFIGETDIWCGIDSFIVSRFLYREVPFIEALLAKRFMKYSGSVCARHSLGFS